MSKGAVARSILLRQRSTLLRGKARATREFARQGLARAKSKVLQEKR
jgi:hypothetical protein